jgi:hypothetical protein
MTTTTPTKPSPTDAPALFQRKGVLATMVIVSVLSIAAIIWAASLASGGNPTDDLPRDPVTGEPIKKTTDGTRVGTPAGEKPETYNPFRPGPSQRIKEDKTPGPPPKGQKGATY